jgi:hypothetical protein
VAAASISNAQLETVVYANQRFAQRLPGGARAGFFLVGPGGGGTAVEGWRWALTALAAYGHQGARADDRAPTRQHGHAIGRPTMQGDGAGVGKGRQIAALIREFFETGGSRVLWVSTRCGHSMQGVCVCGGV